MLELGSGFVFAFFVRIEEVVRAGVLVDVVAVDGFGGGQRLALRLTLGFVGGAGNVERDGDLDFRVQRDGDIGAGRSS